MKELYKALAAFQAEVPTIKKNASGYGYKFADLEEINNIIKPLLVKHGLGYAQPLVGTAVKTILFHTDSGESIESSVEVPQGVTLKGQNEFQVMGSAITYFRRYSLASLLGLVTDEDADAAGKQTTRNIAQKTSTAAVKSRSWQPSDNKPVSDDQRMMIANLLRSVHGIDNKTEITQWLWDNWQGEPQTEAQAHAIVESLDAERKELLNEQTKKQPA